MMRMKGSAAMILLAVSLAAVLVSSAADKRCADNSRSCASSGDCCSGCCSLGQCTSYDRCTVAAQGACALHNCPPDKECYLQQVQCVTAPCPPIPACRPKNSDDYVYD